MNESTLKSNFGATVRHFRIRRRMTQQELGDAAGLTRTYIADIERGFRNPALANIVRLAKALDVRLSSIFAAMTSQAGGSRGMRQSPQ